MVTSGVSYGFHERLGERLEEEGVPSTSKYGALGRKERNLKTIRSVRIPASINDIRKTV